MVVSEETGLISFVLAGEIRRGLDATKLRRAIFDALDGRAARLLRVTSKFGAVLDSLSDFVSFGVAPAVILHQRTLSHLINDAGPGGANIFALIAVTTYALCAGLRLARFTSAAVGGRPKARS